jgi:hypothetical protein
MSYSDYATSGSLYLFFPASTPCAKCVRRSVRYDGNFSVDDFDHLTIEQRKLETVCNAILERIP